MKIVNAARAFVACAAAFAAVGVAQAQGVIKIGLIAEFSGPFAQYGQQIYGGMKTYMKQHGDTVAGKKIEIIQKDVGGPAPDVAKRLAQELVAEIVEAHVLGPERVQDGVVDQLLERVLELVRGPVHDAGQHRRHEAPTEDRAGPGHGLGVGAEPRRAGEDGVEIHLAQATAFIGDVAAVDDLMPADQPFGFGAAMGFDHADDEADQNGGQDAQSGIDHAADGQHDHCQRQQQQAPEMDRAVAGALVAHVGDKSEDRPHPDRRVGQDGEYGRGSSRHERVL